MKKYNTYCLHLGNRHGIFTVERYKIPSEDILRYVSRCLICEDDEIDFTAMSKEEWFQDYIYCLIETTHSIHSEVKIQSYKGNMV